MIQKIFSHLPDYIKDADAPWTEFVDEDIHVAVYRDQYPVSNGHLLFIPKYNSMAVLAEAMEQAAEHGRFRVKNGDWDGFNLGLNYGKAAGQTVDWPHVHLIPRYQGDVKDPAGGVRGVIPGKANYRN